MLSDVMYERVRNQPGGNDIAPLIHSCLEDIQVPLLTTLDESSLPEVGTKEYAAFTRYLELHNESDKEGPTQYIDTVDYILAKSGQHIVDHRCCRYCIKCSLNIGHMTRLQRLLHYSQCPADFDSKYYDETLTKEQVAILNTSDLRSRFDPTALDIDNEGIELNNIYKLYDIMSSEAPPLRGATSRQ